MFKEGKLDTALCSWGRVLILSLMHKVNPESREYILNGLCGIESFWRGRGEIESVK